MQTTNDVCVITGDFKSMKLLTKDKKNWKLYNCDEEENIYFPCILCNLTICWDVQFLYDILTKCHKVKLKSET